MIRIHRPICPHPAALSNNDHKHHLNKAALRAASFGKCMYCESKITHIDHADIEHIKPKAPGMYPHLEFVWDNHGYSCTICNGSKHDKYEASTPYINPYEEDPSDHLIFLAWFIKAKKGSERGALTITDIDLNRPDLVEQRREKIESVLTAIDSCYKTANVSLQKNALQALISEAGSDREYSLAIRHLLQTAGVI
jgi:uncharacterized protein (TIGR02646 family)